MVATKRRFSVGTWIVMSIVFALGGILADVIDERANVRHAVIRIFAGVIGGFLFTLCRPLAERIDALMKRLFTFRRPL